MIVLSLAEIAAVTGGTLADTPDPDACVTGPAASDSRQVTPGGLFARHALGRIKDVTVIALTGSAGKTTTKDILAQVLARHGATVATPGSFNTEIGLPLTVLRADETTRYLVLEMGARHAGDIRYLTTLTPPRVGIVLNVGSAHLGEFGTRQAIGQAKAELVQALPEAADGGIAILNADDDIVAGMARHTTAAIITYGTGQADIRAAGTHLIDGAARFTLHTPSGSVPVILRLLGAHQVHNALAAAAAAHALDMHTGSIAAALSSAEPRSPGRLQILQADGGITIINDAFNANPESTAAGLRSLAGYARPRRTVAVLGEMRELGPAAEAAHRDTGRLAADLGIDILITVGHGPMDTLGEAARTSPAPPAIHAAEDPDALLPMLRRLLQPGDVVFIKASRSVGLENFAAVLKEDGPARTA